MTISENPAIHSCYLIDRLSAMLREKHERGISRTQERLSLSAYERGAVRWPIAAGEITQLTSTTLTIGVSRLHFELTAQCEEPGAALSEKTRRTFIAMMDDFAQTVRQQCRFYTPVSIDESRVNGYALARERAEAALRYLEEWEVAPKPSTPDKKLTFMRLTMVVSAPRSISSCKPA